MAEELTTGISKLKLNAISGVGRAINPASEISFTLGKGVINKIFYPREDQELIQDIRLIVTDGRGFFFR